MTENALFLDTAYIYALFNKRDRWHGQALQWQQKIAVEKLPLLTTEFVLIEIDNGLSSLKLRDFATEITQALQKNEYIEIIPASSELFLQALKLFEQQQDKSWGLTDCTSFVVMNENKVSAALTTDNHFRQAGFKALLLD